MTPEDFKAWRKSLNLTQTEAAEALGISRGSVELYELGKRRDDGRPVEIPKSIALACAAVRHKLPPVGEKREGTPKRFRIIISAANDLEHFTVDTMIENAVDEHQALSELLSITEKRGDEPVDYPLQNLRFVRD
jgi:transcriptional regulator with XRE-family HTH domain